jgi:hypothetical protein
MTSKPKAVKSSSTKTVTKKKSSSSSSKSSARTTGIIIFVVFVVLAGLGSLGAYLYKNSFFQSKEPLVDVNNAKSLVNNNSVQFPSINNASVLNMAASVNPIQAITRAFTEHTAVAVAVTAVTFLVIATAITLAVYFSVFKSQHDPLPVKTDDPEKGGKNPAELLFKDSKSFFANKTYTGVFSAIVAVVGVGLLVGAFFVVRALASSGNTPATGDAPTTGCFPCGETESHVEPKDHSTENALPNKPINSHGKVDSSSEEDPAPKVDIRTEMKKALNNELKGKIKIKGAQ